MASRVPLDQGATQQAYAQANAPRTDAWLAAYEQALQRLATQQRIRIDPYNVPQQLQAQAAALADQATATLRMDALDSNAGGQAAAQLGNIVTRTLMGGQ